MRLALWTACERKFLSGGERIARRFDTWEVLARDPAGVLLAPLSNECKPACA
jgi:hypothetical protein